MTYRIWSYWRAKMGHFRNSFGWGPWSDHCVRNTLPPFQFHGNTLRYSTTESTFELYHRFALAWDLGVSTTDMEFPQGIKGHIRFVLMHSLSPGTSTVLQYLQHCSFTSGVLNEAQNHQFSEFRQWLWCVSPYSYSLRTFFSAIFLIILKYTRESSVCPCSCWSKLACSK